MAGTPSPAAGEARRGDWRRSLIAGLLGVLIGAVVMAAASGYFVRRALLANPEIIPEAMERLQSRQTGLALQPHRAALETPFHGAWAGAEQPDVVLVEFFDYACGYCRASNAHIDRLLSEDPRLRVVWREFPVLGPDSRLAAAASLAAARAGRYRLFYDRLFGAGRPSAATIAAARQAAGLGDTPVTPEIERELQRNYELARLIDAQGTPTFVVGNRILHGAVGYEALREAIAQARAERDS